MRNAATLTILVSMGLCEACMAATVSCEPTHPGGNEFIPSAGSIATSESGGKRHVQQQMTWHSRERLSYFRNVDTTFEPDAFFYNYDGNVWAKRPIPDGWSSDLPGAYLDTQAFDAEQEKAITIGSADPGNLVEGKIYISTMEVHPEASPTSMLKLMSQRGKLVAGSLCPLGAEYCSFGCNAVTNFRTIPFERENSAPGCVQYTWNYNGSGHQAC